MCSGFPEPDKEDVVWRTILTKMFEYPTRLGMALWLYVLGSWLLSFIAVMFHGLSFTGGMRRKLIYPLVIKRTWTSQLDICNHRKVTLLWVSHRILDLFIFSWEFFIFIIILKGYLFSLRSELWWTWGTLYPVQHNGGGRWNYSLWSVSTWLWFYQTALVN